MPELRLSRSFFAIKKIAKYLLGRAQYIKRYVLGRLTLGFTRVKSPPRALFTSTSPGFNLPECLASSGYPDLIMRDNAGQIGILGIVGMFRLILGTLSKNEIDVKLGGSRS